MGNRREWYSTISLIFWLESFIKAKYKYGAYEGIEKRNSFLGICKLRCSWYIQVHVKPIQLEIGFVHGIAKERNLDWKQRFEHQELGSSYNHMYGWGLSRNRGKCEKKIFSFQFLFKMELREMPSVIEWRDGKLFKEAKSLLKVKKRTKWLWEENRWEERKDHINYHKAN